MAPRACANADEQSAGHPQHRCGGRPGERRGRRCRPASGRCGGANPRIDRSRRREVDALLVAAAGEAQRRGGGELDAMRLIWRWCGRARGCRATGRGGASRGWWRGSRDSGDVAALRGLARGGELARPLGVAALRRSVARVCGRGRCDKVPEELAWLSAASWEALLEALARSLAVERPEEVEVDARVGGLDEDGLVARRNRVRALLDGWWWRMGGVGAGGVDAVDRRALAAGGARAAGGGAQGGALHAAAAARGRGDGGGVRGLRSGAESQESR